MPDVFAGSHDTDFTPPRVENPTPSPGSSGNLPDVTVGFDLVDDTFYGPDLNNTAFTIGGSIAYQNGSWLAGYGGTVTVLSNGYQFRCTTHPELQGITYCQVDSQDTAPIPNVMTTYIWNFTASLETSAKTFMYNSMIRTVDAVSSYFQPKVGNISFQGDGNVALDADVAGNPTVGASYDVRVTKGGKLDRNLDNVQDVEHELGIGQINYTTENTYKGSYSPPGIVIDNGTTVHGIDRSLGKIIYTTDGGGDQFGWCNLCERDDDSLFVIARNDTDDKDLLYSIPKIGHTDSSPVSGVELNTAIANQRAVAVIKLSDDYFMMVESITSATIPARLDFVFFDASGNLIDSSTFTPFERDFPFTQRTIYGADAIKVGNALYVMFSHTTDSGGDNSLVTIYTIKSLDNGRSWEFVRTPGKDTYSTIQSDTFWAEIEDTKTYEGQFYPRIYHDEVDDQYLVTFYSTENTATTKTRYLTVATTDFVTWSRVNYPVVKEAVAGTDGEDLDPGARGKLVRFNGEYMLIGNMYMAIFKNDDTLNGLRRGMFWREDNTTDNLGASIKYSDILISGGIAYLASTINSSATDQGFVVHALGAMTNLPDKTHYASAYFGSIAKPSEGYGYAEQITGTPSATPGATGLFISSASGERLYYDRTDLNTSMGSGAKFRFVMKPVSDDGIGTSSAQGIAFKLQTTSTGSACVFTVTVSKNGVRLRDDVATLNYDYTFGSTLTEFKQFIVAYQPTSGSAASVKIFMADDGADHDTWTQLLSATLQTAFDSTNFIRVGNINVVSGVADSEAYWKAVYYADRTSNLDFAFDPEDSLTTYASATDEDELEPLAMTIEGESQAAVGGLSLQWQGLDAYYGDTWTFTVGSQHGAGNVFTKSPWYLWRSGANTAASGTSTDQYIQLDADDDDLGMFVFDLVAYLHGNFRFCKLQANDDGTSWSPATYELDISPDLDSGTFSADYSRIDDDLITVKDTTKSWLHGEFKGDYVMLQRLHEAGLSGAPDNDYYNVAFLIVDNGPDYLVISTKGLAVDEAGTGGSKAAMNVVSGEAYIIYGTRKSSKIDEVKAYRYLRLKIPASSSYSDSWTTANQPNLPNERCWRLGEFDVGKYVQFIDDPEYGYSTAYNDNVSSKRERDGKYVVNIQGRPYRTWKFGYDLSQTYDNDSIAALFNALDESAEPFWYVPDVDDVPEEVYLVRSQSDLSSNRIRNEIHENDFVLEEVV